MKSDIGFKSSTAIPAPIPITDGDGVQDFAIERTNIGITKGAIP
jgi:hypothetical protein